ncbi:MAG: EAL domain-containing protein [Sphingomonas sp.]|nr:EAL domain-containing protein [Sphingomonas sp.]
MYKWINGSGGGKRASDHDVAAPAPVKRDRTLESVIAHERIALLFQPQIDPANGDVLGVEALARWDGVASPQDLFARAASAGLAERLSRLVQRKALRAAATWEGPLRYLHLSINLLPEDLARSGYDRWLLEEIDTAGVDPARITVEITESALLSDSLAIAERLGRLRSAGIRVAIDDFGTGYASLAYLTSLPLDILKIDRGLIADIVGGERARIVVKAMIALAKELNLTVVVEGVESTGQLALLADWGCDLYQGFLGAGPLDEMALARFVSASMAQAA